MESYPGRDRAIAFAFAPQSYPLESATRPIATQPKNCHPEQSEGSASPPAFAVLSRNPQSKSTSPPQSKKAGAHISRLRCGKDSRKARTSREPEFSTAEQRAERIIAISKGSKPSPIAHGPAARRPSNAKLFAAWQSLYALLQIGPLCRFLVIWNQRNAPFAHLSPTVPESNADFVT